MKLNKIRRQQMLVDSILLNMNLESIMIGNSFITILEEMLNVFKKGTDY